MVENNTDFLFLPRLVPRRDDKIKIKIQNLNIIVDQKSNNSKISSKMNKRYVFELFKKNAARKEFC